MIRLGSIYSLCLINSLELRLIAARQVIHGERDCNLPYESRSQYTIKHGACYESLRSSSKNLDFGIYVLKVERSPMLALWSTERS
jgi:hypothetical protein